jgi:hypothetical protein
VGFVEVARGQPKARVSSSSIHEHTIDDVGFGGSQTRNHNPTRMLLVLVQLDVALG